MNVFVLTAGRTGSTTFARACEHITNYTAGHETRWDVLGPERLTYPDDHIEVDNRLSWLLGRLDAAYGDDAMYVRLVRNEADAAASHAMRIEHGIMRAYREAIIWQVPEHVDPHDVATDYLATVESNIALFLRDKHHVLRFRLEEAATDFERFWRFIGAEGDYEAAVREFGVRHNASTRATSAADTPRVSKVNASELATRPVIEVPEPDRTDTSLEFACLMRELAPWADGAPGGPVVERPIRFGFRTPNARVQHHEVWDGFYPLYFLTRNGGPLFNSAYDQARIRFGFPFPRLVRDYFVQRAADFGIDIEVEAELTEVRLDRPTTGHVLAFGGGKDSRLVLGTLRELGIEPTLVTAQDGLVVPPPGALVVETIDGALADRLMPAIMQLGRFLYVGNGLGEVHRRDPWQQYFDTGALVARTQLRQLLAQLGVDMEIVAPVSVLPHNIIQRILHDRYPELYAGQTSTHPTDRNDKNLRVALLRLYHGLPHLDAIEPGLFPQLLREFVARQLAMPHEHGYRNGNETVELEMRSIIWRTRHHPDLADVSDDIPARWEGPWIDYVHDYVDPQLDRRFLDLYRRFAPLASEADFKRTDPPDHHVANRHEPIGGGPTGRSRPRRHA